MNTSECASPLYLCKRPIVKVITLLAASMMLFACGGGSSDSGGPSVQPPPQPNRAPTISGQAVTEIAAGDMYSFIPNASDPDGDTLTFSVENLSDWMLFNSANGEVSGMPGPSQLGDAANIVITVSDGTLSDALSPFTVSVNPAKVSTDDVVSTGAQDPLPDNELSEGADSGYTTQGDVEVNIAGEPVMIESANLKVEFDADENLVSLVGEGQLPPTIGNFFAINSSAKVRLGLYTGAEINADPDIDILLKDEFYYLVYYAGISTDIEVGNRKGGAGESITLTSPLGAEILMIADPLDTFYYYYANTPAGIKGVGESDQGFIPFEPNQPSPFLDSFEGHEIYKAGTSLGIKVFDFFNIVGDRISKNPQFEDINWEDPLNSDIELKVGFNGVADFALSIFGVGLFEFPVAAASSTIDVGLDRQQMAMQMTIAPDVSWQPDWFTILPSTEVVGEWVINGDETFSAKLSGQYTSNFPDANMSGSMLLNNDGATLEAQIPDAKVPLSVSAQFINSQTIYTLLAEVDIADDVKESVDEAFDTEVAEKTAALDDLEAKTENYEIEVSLNGLRAALPAIADGAIAQIRAIPEGVRSSVRSNVISEINNRRTCTIFGCVPSNSARDSLANAAGNAAKLDADNQIVAPLAAMTELKFRALQGDAEEFRQALEDALFEAHRYRVVSGTIRVNINMPSPISDYTHTHNYSERVINTTNSDRILSAAQNAHRIQQTSDLRIEASDIYDAIPTEEAIEKARSDLAAGLTNIPTFEGAGLTIAGNAKTSFILLSGEQRAVEFNVLNPVELLQGIAEVVSDDLITTSNNE